MINRRDLFVVAAVAALSGCGIDRNPVTIRLGSGRVNGLFHEIAQLLAAVAAEFSTVRIDPVATAGSQMNLDLLARGEIDAALALADSVYESATHPLAIGRLYETYLQMAVLADSAIHQVGDLRGKRVDLGVVGSGAAMTAERVLQAAGLDPAVDVVAGHRQLAGAVEALHSGDTDAILWGGGVPTPGLDIPWRIRLIDLGEFPPMMRERFGYRYDRVVIHQNAYPGGPAVSTVGIPNLLLVAPTLANSAVVAITELLLRNPDRLVPEHAKGFQFLDRRWLVGTGDIPLHPAAADFYRSWHD
ncbi:TAXI family TRAP transporter solute-binding subunit [Nocardia sp. NBC_00881]|uniref:TAXI family TRAP transporter solute-binding subunit n=1 Tax=Nocardia sp. NBC_00881 TaxID=2975995 RepID=UPI003870DE05|nr:TAXI family TRAP transporter solute-binding subunit [Nocardia sp. NBC_00881]